MTDGVKLPRRSRPAVTKLPSFGSYNVNLVLRALRSHGCDHNVLVMDTAQCAASLGDPELAPQLAGRYYALTRTGEAVDWGSGIALKEGFSRLRGAGGARELRRYGCMSD
jgi:hypothetical protein